MMKRKFTMPEGEIREIDMPDFKTPYNHDREFESERTGTFCPEVSMTKQEFKDETDMNTILKRFKLTGEPPPVQLPEHFTDLTERPSYFEMASKLAEANTSFYLLPPDVREKHLNDPTRWADQVLKAVETNNRKKLIDLGIAVPENPQEPDTGTPPVQPTPAGQVAQAPAPAAPQTPKPASGAPKD